MEKKYRLFKPSGERLRPTEEQALRNIAKEKRHQQNLRLFTGWWRGRYWYKGRPQR